MTFRKGILPGILLLLCGALSQAQIKLPPFDVELKIDQIFFPGQSNFHLEGEIRSMGMTSLYGGVNFQFNQYIALGFSYARSFWGSASIAGREAEEILLSQKGLNLRLSAGRAKKLRPYLILSFAQYKIVHVRENFQLADKLFFNGANLGIMCRLNNRLYLNVIELGLVSTLDEIWFVDNMKEALDLKMGFTYNIDRRK